MPTIIACFLTIQDQRHVLTAEQNKDQARTVQVLALGLSEAVWTLVPGMGEPLVDAVMADSRILRIWVDCEEGPFIRRTQGRAEKGHIQTMKSPISYHGKLIGEVLVDIDTNPMERILIKQGIRYLWVFLGPFFLSTVILFWVLNLKFLKPLDRLLLQSKDLAGKKLDQKFCWTQDDEMGILGQSFEQTRQSLAALFQELEQTNIRIVGQAAELTTTNESLQLEVAERFRIEAALIHHQERLEEIISQRTAELTTSNEELKQEIKDRLRAETERREIEIKLQRAEKMEALGTLAGGVAHDLNNILSGIVSYPELLLMDIPKENSLHAPLLMIQQAGERAAVVVQDLLTLARRGVTANEVLDLLTVVSDYLDSPEYRKLLESHSGVKVETDFNDRGLKIKGSRVHIAKTVMNLVANAAEAIPEIGTVRITISPHHSDAVDLADKAMPAGDLLMLSVSDTGSGIRSEDLEHIFEPFYTTKVMGKSGSGLGMAVVWGTVKDHNGHIDIQSKVGFGTNVTIYFPAGEYAKSPKIQEIPESIGMENKRILVVDDLEEQRIITVSMLKKMGFQAMAVASGEAALHVLTERRFDLLILDMMMEPGMDGLETYRRSLKLNPDQQAVIASGYSKTDHIKELRKLGNCGYIKKPFLLNDLKRVLRDALETS
ncbi:hybrid sensor histidine kinase/response regulator [Desulfocicer niacini]